MFFLISVFSNQHSDTTILQFSSLYYFEYMLSDGLSKDVGKLLCVIICFSFIGAHKQIEWLYI